MKLQWPLLGVALGLTGAAVVAPWSWGIALSLLATGLFLPVFYSASAQAEGFDAENLEPRASVIALLWWLAHALIFLALLYLPLRSLARDAGLFAALALSLVLGVAPLLFRRSHAWLEAVLREPVPTLPWREALAHWRSVQWRDGDPAERFWQRSYLIHLACAVWVAGALSLWLWPSLGEPWSNRLGAALLALAVVLSVVHAMFLPRARPDPAEPIADYFDVLPSVGPDAATLDPDQDLIRAVRAADDAQVERLLRLGANPNAEPPFDALDRRSALISAATCGQLSILRRLIAAGADLHRTCGDLNALLAATRDSYEGRPDAVLMLLSNGADPDQADALGATALHHAARSRDAAVVQHLLDRKANVHALDHAGWTPAAWAAQAQNLDVLEALLRAGSVLEPDGGVPVLVAAAEGRNDTTLAVQRLLQAKADIQAKDRKGRSALHVAAALDHAHVCECLIAAGAALEARDLSACTPWLSAAQAAARRALARLMFKGARTDVVDAKGASALHLAVTADEVDAELIAMLMAAGVDPELRNSDGLSALELALRANRFDLARELSETHDLPDAVAELQSEENSRDGLISEALRQGKRDVAERLLELGPIETARWPELLASAAGHPSGLLDKDLLKRCQAAGLDLHSPAPVLSLCALRPLPVASLNTLLEAGASVRGELDRGCTPLLLLAGLEHPLDDGELDLVDGLLARMLALGADADARDSLGRPLLVHALRQWPVLALARLLDAVKDPNATGNDGRGALHQLLLQGRADTEVLVRALLLAGCDPNHHAGDGSSPLGLALQQGKLELCPLLDWPPGAHPGRALSPTDVPEAARRGDLQALSRLLELGLSVDARDSRGACGALHAAGRGDLDVMELLLEAGARMDLPAASGMAPLGAAVVARQHAVIRWLLEQGLDIHAPQAQGYSALALAALAGDLETCELLLDCGAQVERHAEGSKGQAALRPGWVALRALLQDARPDSPHMAVLQRLLEAGTDPNLADDDGRSMVLLLCGAQQSSPPLADEPRINALISLLQTHGAELNLPDRMGRTAAHWVCRHGLLGVFEHLLSLGADPRLPDDLRKLPGDLAQARHRSEIAALIEQYRN